MYRLQITESNPNHDYLKTYDGGEKRLFAKGTYSDVWNFATKFYPFEIDLYFKYKQGEKLTDRETNDLRAFFMQRLAIDRKLYNYIAIYHDEKKINEICI